MIHYSFSIFDNLVLTIKNKIMKSTIIAVIIFMLSNVLVIGSLITPNDNHVEEIQDLPDNVYESLILSFPDANDKELIDLYYQYEDKLNSLSYDEVLIF